MKTLFILASELTVFTFRHPEYKHFERVKDKTGEVVGYNASVPKRRNRPSTITCGI